MQLNDKICRSPDLSHSASKSHKFALAFFKQVMRLDKSKQATCYRNL